MTWVLSVAAARVPHRHRTGAQGPPKRIPPKNIAQNPNFQERRRNWRREGARGIRSGSVRFSARLRARAGPEVDELDGQFELGAPAEADRPAEGPDAAVLVRAEGHPDLEGGGGQDGLLEPDAGQEGAPQAHVANHGGPGIDLLPRGVEDLDLGRKVDFVADPAAKIPPRVRSGGPGLHRLHPALLLYGRGPRAGGPGPNLPGAYFLPFFFDFPFALALSTACAAASRAIGSRYGE